MVTPGSRQLARDVITLRISHLSRSTEFRQYLLAQLNNGADPFNLGDVNVGGVSIDIVGDEPDTFAGKLDDLLGSGAGDAYLQEAEQLSPAYLTDTPQNRQHLWDWWKDAAARNPALADQIRQALVNTLGEGGAVAFSGDYSGNSQQPEAVVSPDDQGNPRVLFRTDEGPRTEKV